MRHSGPLAALLWLLAAPLAAIDRHVDPVAGKDLPDCSDPALPCKTLGFALRNAKSGDTVRGGPGTYATASGESFPIVVPPGVVLASTGGPAVTTIRNDSPAGSPFTVQISRYNPLFAPTGIAGFTVDGGGHPANGYGVFVESTLAKRGPGEETPFVRGLRVQGFANAGIGLYTWGFSLLGGTNQLDAVVEDNDVRLSARGISVVAYSDNDPKFTAAIDYSTVRNNVVIGCGTGIHLVADRAVTIPAPTDRARLYTELRHNTVLASGGDSVAVAAPDGTDSALAVQPDVSNNVLVGGGGYGVNEFDLASDAARLAANDIFDNVLGGYWDADTKMVYTTAGELKVPAAVSGLANLAVNPMLGPTTGRPQLSSPCIDAADPAYSAPDDFDGQLRPVGLAPDIGAFEVLVLKRGVFTDLAPMSPARATLFPNLPAYAAFTAPAWIDPETVLRDESRPLIVYALQDGVPATLLMVKAGAPIESVRITY